MRTFLIIATLLLAGAAQAGEAPVGVTFTSYAADGETITGYLFRPDDPGPFPAIVALHGCGGLFKRNGQAFSSRHADWAQRFHKAGYVVLFPDSFGSRGHESLCKVKKRPVKHADRVGDARAAADWLTGQDFIDAGKLVLLGWSNGGSTVMRAVAPDAAPLKTDFKAAIAFYPSCRWALNKAAWQPRIKPVIHIGAADDWTPPGPCKELAAKWGLRLALYKGAYHGFDAPNSKVRVLTGRAYSSSGDGKVHVGTNHAARKAAIADVMNELKAEFASKP